MEGNSEEMFSGPDPPTGNQAAPPSGQPPSLKPSAAKRGLVGAVETAEDPGSKRRKVNAPREVPSMPKVLSLAQKGYDDKSIPIMDISEMFMDMVRKCLILEKNPIEYEIGLQACASHLKGVPLNMATMCSGTEAPNLAVRFIFDLMHQLDPSLAIQFNHLFSAEIVPFKQHYIETNFSPPILFADITELAKKLPPGQTKTNRTLTTAYGGQARVPGKVDLFVAGFSCVDFSNLNSCKKALEDGGESGDTFFAMREYAKHYRPVVIILENVKAAPWKDAIEKIKKTEKPRTGLDVLMGEIGYASKHILVDTKDYYLPQTRQRGYMVCVDRLAYREDKACDATLFFPDWEAQPLVNDEKLEAHLDKWAKIVQETLKRPASVPAELMFLRSDDPALEALTSMDSYSTRKAASWDTCRIGYNNYRETESLGKKRELTEWVNGGAYVPEDYMKRPSKGIGERVLDTLDIAHLRNIRRGIDDRYANRILELSQNVYRVTDTSKGGIIGCLTPNGIPYLTTRGGRIIGHEALILQGLGLDELELDMLSQGNLQDMAGNAMTSTVVGAAIAAALSVFYPKFRIEGKDSKPEPTATTLDISGGEILQEKVKVSSTHEITLSAASAVEQAKLTRRLCACEGRVHQRGVAFQRCTTCFHTTCKKCGVKPRHHYVNIPTEEIKERKGPNYFEDLIKRSVPASISLKTSSIEINSLLQKISEEYAKEFGDSFELCTTFQRALSSEVYLRDIRRDEYWEVQYDSPDAKVVLTISENKVEWRLYANVDNDGLGTPRGKFFRRFPIARMRPDGDDINEGRWFIWVPEKPNSQLGFAAHLKWSGELINNFANQRGLPEMDTEYVYSTCELVIPTMDSRYFDRDVQGRYKLSQECGQPHNTLHAREREENEHPLFFYLEQHLRTGNPDPSSGDHYFVFTEETHRLEKLDHRATIANFEKTWRPPIVKVKTKEYPLEDYSLFHHLKNHKDVQYIDKLEDAQTIYLQDGTVCVDGRWVSLTSLSIDTQGGTELSYHVLPADPSSLLELSDSCKSSATAVLSLDVVLTGKISASWVREKWSEITRANEAKFLREFGWTLVQGCILDGHTQDANIWHVVVPKQERCFDCAPQPPPLLWSMNTEGKAIPCEEPLAATVYERQMKSRPPAFSTRFLITRFNKLSLVFGINPQTLIDRAVALLPCLPATFASWRLVTDDVTYPNASLKELTVKDNKGRIAEVDIKLKNGYKLKPEQMRAVDWVIARDRGGVVFTEEEVVEARMSRFGYRLEAKAVRDVKPRGGLLFFDVGFGKTVITLALIQHRRDDDDRVAKDKIESIERRKSSLKGKAPMKHDTPLEDETRIKGKIPLKATIIFMPDHLPGQWAAEVDKFLGEDVRKKVLVIKSIADLKKLTVRNFQDAELIIVSWNFLENPAYNSALADLAGIVDRDDSGSLRSKTEWYKKALSNISDTVVQLYENREPPKDVWETLGKNYAADDLQSSQTKVAVPTKRQRGVKDKTEKATKKKTFKPYVPRKRNPNTFNIEKIEDFRDMKCPLFEIFSYARKVVDEFTYLFHDRVALLIFKNLSASSTFGLSGTPSTGNFADVKEMASLLGIHLGIDDYSSLKTDAFNKATQDFSRAELFLAYKAAESTAWHQNRRVVAQRFLDEFARKDAANISSIRCVHHYHLVDLDPAHAGVYLELQQRISSSTFENLRTKNVDSEVERLIQEIICGSDDANEALLLRASHLKLTGDHLYRMQVEAAQAAQEAKEAKDKKPSKTAGPNREDKAAGENEGEEVEETQAAVPTGEDKTTSDNNVVDVEEIQAAVPTGEDKTTSDNNLVEVEETRAAVPTGEDKAAGENEVVEVEETQAAVPTGEDKTTSDNNLVEVEETRAAVPTGEDKTTSDNNVVEVEETQAAVPTGEDKTTSDNNVVEVEETQAAVPTGEDKAAGENEVEEVKETQAAKPVVKKKSKTKKKRIDISELVAPDEVVTTESMIRTRSIQLQKLLEDEAMLLKKAFWLQSQEEAAGCDRFNVWIQRLEKNDGFHDEESRKLLLAAINKAELASTKKDWVDFYREKGEDLGEDDPRRQLPELPTGFNLNSNTSHLTKVAAQLRTTTVSLNRLGEVIVNHNRSLRFMKAIADIQGGRITCSLCNETTNPQDVTLLSGCGHAICPMHRNLLKDGADCAVYGCDAQIKDIQKFTSQQLCSNPRSSATKHGHKVDDIIKLIQKCKANGDKVVIFAQFQSLIQVLLKALEEADLKFKDLTSEAADKSSELQDFQDPNKNDYHGLILNPSGASASGANLTITNHIVFVHPLHTAGRGAQASWESTMIQAIGRARRYGQEKTVHVHHFLSVATIDIDCFEHRTGKFVRRKPGCPMSVGELVDRTEGAQSTLNSRIAHINYPDEITD